MPRTTQCPKCGVALNLPEDVAGKKLKCPRCNTRFAADGHVVPRPESRAPGSDPTSSVSSLLLTTRPSEPEIPTAEGDLRETFAPELLMGEAPSGPTTGRPAEADAATLFREPTPRRRPATAGDARAQARRCPSCASVVPVGMSLCARCGLDLDTGQRHDLDELFEVPPPPPRRQGQPTTILVIGGLTFMVSLLLALLAVTESQRPDEARWITVSLATVGLFGLFAAVQFLRGKALKPLITALLLGAALDIALLIVYPSVLAYSAPTVPEPESQVVGVQDDMPQFVSVAERMQAQMWKINWGIIILLIVTGLIVYLLTGGVRRHFERRRTPSSLPIP